ncbi:hypothetical protein KUV80_17220 [Fictibacillus nanhaiensis]|uniref:hypothetical protein n=1 Tax=Fictibacillus nanhaiensis TaxID=742169 RepID=UPI001C93965C|nr:hypothetical protein [Fictibacillus nanhaiensis]MBY6038382.1 hypothetical protein [Fictibacillus nanhaiensis]
MITVFMEYKVNPDTFQSYETVMTSVIKELEMSGASDIRWYRAADQPSLYVECFQVYDIDAYKAIKDARTSHDHPVFSRLHALVSGGFEKIHCWAFEKMNVKEDI